MLPRFLTKREFADAVGVTPRTVNNWMREGRLTPARTPGGHCRFPRELVKQVKEAREPKRNQARPKLLTVSQLAAMLCVYPSTIRSWVTAGKLQPDHVTPGGHSRFSMATGHRLLLQRELNPKLKTYRPDKPAVLNRPLTAEQWVGKTLIIRKLQRMKAPRKLKE